MPHFFFHVHDGISLPDTEGQWHPNLKSAMTEAVQRAGALLLRNPDQFWNDEHWSIDVRDEHDAILCTLRFIATISPAGGETHHRG